MKYNVDKNPAFNRLWQYCNLQNIYYPNTFILQLNCKFEQLVTVKNSNDVFNHDFNFLKDGKTISNKQKYDLIINDGIDAQ